MNAKLSTLTPLHTLLAVAVTFVWGTNFVVIALGLETLPPFLFVALRYALSFALLALFIKPPKGQWALVTAYGTAIGVGQFGLLFFAMDGKITAGLASLVVQTQVFFTVIIAALTQGERFPKERWLGLALAAGGILVIALNRTGSTSLLGIALVLGAALSWAIGNTLARATALPLLPLVVWSSLLAAPQLFVIAWWVEGGEAIRHSLAQADAGVWLAVLWQAIGNTLFGYTAWGWLMARYQASTVSPIAFLVPVFGLLAASWWLNEPLELWKLAASGLVLAGLALNTWQSARSSRLPPPAATVLPK